MSTSNHEQISTVVKIITRINPNSLLDIGVGFGKYGLLAREYLENGEQQKIKWLHRIDGIEVFRSNENVIYQYIYDSIYMGDVCTLLSQLDLHYDMIIMIDVLEHFTFKEGEELLQTLLEKTDYVLISTPKDIGTQGVLHENHFEVHKAQWKKKSLKMMGKSYFFSNPEQYICLFSERLHDFRYFNVKNKISVCIPLATSLFRKFFMMKWASKSNDN